MKKFLNRNNKFIWLAVGALFLIISLLPYYVGDYLILGGEGNNFLNFSVYLYNFRDTWQNAGTGFFTTSLGATFVNVFLLSFLEKLITNLQIINFLIIFSIYYLPFLGMFLVSRQLKLSSRLSFLIAAFYVINPFTIYLLTGLNQWNLAPLFLIPVFFWLFLKYYYHRFRLFFSFGLLSLFFAFANTNPPLMGVIQISIFILTVIASYYLEKKLKVKEIITRYLLVLSSFILFNFWWILNWFYVLLEARKMYATETALGWLLGEERIAIFHKMFILKWLIPSEKTYNFFALFYNYSFIQWILTIPILLILFSFLQKRKKKLSSLIFLFLLIMAFLMKGTRPPFGEAYVFLVKYLPFFSIFKTSAEKWGVIFIFLFSLLLAFSFKNGQEKKQPKWVYSLFIVYLLFCSYPLISNNFIPDYKIKNLGWGSRRYQEKKEYSWAREILNDDEEEYRILSLPGSFNYQVAMHMYADKYYTGLDPLVNNINKQTITSYGNNILVNFDVLFSNLSSPDLNKLLSLFNVKKILLNKDIYPWFGFNHRETIEELEQQLNDGFLSEKNGSIILYENNQFLPRFYVPDYQIYAFTGKAKNLMEIVELEGSKEKPAIFFQEEIESDLFQGADSLIVFAKTNKINDSELIKSHIDPGAVLFPYVKWSPKSILYPLVLEKEKLIERFQKNDPQALFKKKLLYAAKRISEIEKFFPKYKADELIGQLKLYQQKMESAIEIAPTIEDEELFLMLYSHLKAHRNKIQSLNFSLETVSQIGGIFGELEKKLDKLATKRNYNRMIYKFNIPLEGEYETLAKIDNNTIASIEIDGEKVDPQKTEREDWYSFGERSFSAKEYDLDLWLEEPLNLVGFQDWTEFSLVKEDEGNFSFFLENLFPTDLFEDCSHDCAFYPNKGNFVISQEIKDYRPNSIFRIQFDYLSKEAVLGFAIVQNGDKDIRTGKIYPGLLRILPQETNLEHIDYLFKSGHNSSKAEFYFFSRAEDQKLGEAKIQNVKIQRIYEPEIILRRRNSSTFSKELSLPEITFQKVNSTKYQVNVKGATEPFWLIFQENFHRGWQVYLDKELSPEKRVVASYFDGQVKQLASENRIFDRSFFKTWTKEPIAEEKHYSVNSYANAWFITPQDTGRIENYQIIIEYWPQKLFYLGVGISLIAFLGCFSFALIKSMIRQ